MIVAKRSFKGYSEEHKMIKLEEFISLSGGEAVSGRFSNDWTKTFERRKIKQGKQYCLNSDIEKFGDDCIIEPKMNCFNCEVQRSRQSCLDLISQRRHNVRIIIC